MTPSLSSLPRRWWWPLIFFQLYLSLTVWLLFYGPWPWSIENPGELFVYLMAAQVSIAAGYLLSWRRVVAVPHCPGGDPQTVRDGLAMFKTALWVTAVLAVPSSLSRTGAWLPQVVDGIDNAGLAYNENFDRLDGGNAFVVVEYLRMLASPWLTALMPLTVLYWSRIDWGTRLFALTLIVFNLATYLATGVNKGIADLVVTLPWLVLLAVTLGTLKIERIGLKLTISSASLLGAFLIFFGQGQQQREGSGSEYGTFFTGVAVLQADSGHFISALLPEQFRLIFEALSRYVVHGYYALSLALQTDSNSTFGFGHSMFLARNADLAFGTDYFVSQSIPGLLERDHLWGMFQLWHSIYPWLASDFGFIGALFILGVLAYLLGLSWGRALTTGSAPWTVLLFLLLVLFFYVPANNQVFQSGETFVAFFILLYVVLSGEGQSRLRSSDHAVA